MKKLGFLFVFVSLTNITGFSQNVSELRHTISFDPLCILIKTITASYSYRLDEKHEIRINPRISFDSQEDNLFLGFKLVEDPFWYYNSYGLQVGVSRMLLTKFYIEPMIYYKHATFEDRMLQTVDVDGDSYDEYQIMDRTYNGGGLVLRSGWRTDKGNYRFNFFYGLGYYLRYYDEKIKEQRPSRSVPPGKQFPINSSYWKDGMTVHVGIELGLRY